MSFYQHSTIPQFGLVLNILILSAPIGVATPIILVGRELQEAKKTDLEIERLKQVRQESPSLRVKRSR